MSEKIGFIGLGIMGYPMAKNMIEKSGKEVRVFDLSKDAMNKILKINGAVACSSSSDVARESNVIFIIVPDSPHVKSIIFGEKGVCESAKKGTIIVDMSSISPDISKEIGAKCKEMGFSFLDAPVSGGEPKAIDGTLTFMVGGNEKDFNIVLPYLKYIGSKVTLIGDIGSGTSAKLANQIIVNLNIAALSEAMTLINKLGLDANKVIEAISKGSAGSWVMDAKAKMMIERNFKAGGRIDINKKDIKNILETSHKAGMSLPLTAYLYEIFQSLSAFGEDSLDHSAILHFYENINNMKVK